MGKVHDPRILEAATSVFLRFGYRKTTMGDIAEATGMSRPALYLRYCNKEKIFEAVLKDFSARTLEEIRAGLSAQKTPADQLRFAFDSWVIRPFLLLQASPEARDIASCGLSFAEEVVERATEEFEALLRPILGSIRGEGASSSPSLEQTAHMLAASAHGFKLTARNPEELKAMIHALLELTEAALRQR